MLSRKTSRAINDMMEPYLPKLSPAVQRLLPPKDAVWKAHTHYSCFLPDHGYFFLVQVADTNKYKFMKQGTSKQKKCKSYANGLFDGGETVDRFLSCSPTSILVQFGGSDELLFVSTKNDWETIELQPLPESYLPSYLGTDAVNSPPPALKGLRKKGKRDVIFYCDGDGGTVEGHTTILRKKWPFLEEILSSIDHKPSDPEPLGLTTEYPSAWMEALFDFIYGESKPMDWRTAHGAMVLGNVFRIPELRAIAEAWVYQSDVSSFDAFHIWRQVHTFSEAVSNFCINRIKSGEIIKDRVGFILLLGKIEPVKQEQFVRQFCPNVACE